MAEYTDRDAFKKSVEARYCKPCKAEGKDHNGYWCRACYKTDVLDEVDAQPTVDAVPVVHGRWIPFHSQIAGDIQYCSACEIGFIAKTNYCPNCGAKMDGGDDHAAN